MDRGSFLKVPELVFLSVVLVLSLSLFLSNLGNIYLWQDEAQTALLAKTILQFGFPKGYDGVNFFSQELGAEYGKEYIWKWHPWFPFYLLALVFKVFGVSTFTARLPFALFGILTIFLLYFFTRSLLKNRTVAGISTMLLLFMVPFILLSRQSRYYSVATFFSVGGALRVLGNDAGEAFCALPLFSILNIVVSHSLYLLCDTSLHSFPVHSSLLQEHLENSLCLDTCSDTSQLSVDSLVFHHEVFGSIPDQSF
ncbi:MAG: ArnT family glycosyltransferase [Nitrospinota bacterium]